MLRYILGRAGYGKSRRVMDEIKLAMEQGSNEPLVLLVPDQYTLQAERDLIEKLQLAGIMQVEVLSFTRLASRIFTETGGLTRVLINEQGKNMVLRRVINQNLKSLTIYRQAAKQPGFVAKCGEMISELKQYDIDPSILKERAVVDNDDSTLGQKINDIILIYEAFNGYLQDRYVDMEDYINLFIEKLSQSHYLRGSRLWIDNFATFSPQSLRIIERLIPLAEQVTVSLTKSPDQRSRDHELFALSESTARKLHDMAVKWGVPEETAEISGEEKGTKSSELKHLERELYSYPYHHMTGETERIHAFAAANIFSEVENMAVRMVELARDKAWRWKEMVVVCQDLDTYGPIIKQVFGEYHIPYFMDEKREIINHPIIQFILSSLDIVQRGYRREDICRCCKTGFTFLTSDESDELENYLLAYGSQGKRMKEDFTIGDPLLLEALNALRARLIEPVMQLEASLAEAVDLGGFTIALNRYLESMGICEKLEIEIENMNQRGWLDMVRESTQIWNTVIDTLDQLYSIMGDQSATLKEYRQLLEAGFLCYELGIIPTTIDQILVGTIQRSISQNVRGLFVLGVNDGVLPGTRRDDSLITEEEKVHLESLGIEVGLSRDMKIAQEDYLIYNALSKPGEELWLSFALADGEGRAMRPSLLLNRIRQIFKLELVSDLVEDSRTRLDKIATPGSTLKYLVHNLRQDDEGRPCEDVWWDVFAWYGESQLWRPKRDIVVQGFNHRNQVGNINAELVGKIYPRPFRTSISRLEKYANCPFAHFVRYGMRPAERKTFEVSAPDIGELFHAAFQNMAGKIGEHGLEWKDLKKKQCDELIDSVIDEMVPDYGNGVFTSTYRYRYLVTRLKRIGRRSAWTMTRHIQAGDFTPIGYEIAFGRDGDLPPVEITLEDGEKLYLEGRIDRADHYIENDDEYLRVVDYKAGNKRFSLADAYYGLSLQLLVYLKALLNKGSVNTEVKLHPAGVLYFRIDDPAVQTDEEILEEIEKRIARELRMDGLVLRDVNIVRAMDREMERSSSIIPVSFKRDGDFDAYSAVMDEEEFARLLRHVEVLLGKLSEEIMRGQARIDPVMIDQKKACDYCEYLTICQFDQLFENNRYRRLPKLNRGEVLDRISRIPSERGDQ